MNFNGREGNVSSEIFDSQMIYTCVSVYACKCSADKQASLLPQRDSTLRTCSLLSMAVTCYRGLTSLRAFIYARDSSWLNARHYAAHSKPKYCDLALCSYCEKTAR